MADKLPDKLGVALVGLGTYASEQLAPALEEAKLAMSCIVRSQTKRKRENENNIRIRAAIYANFDEVSNNRPISFCGPAIICIGMAVRVRGQASM